jgi:4-diphosphocytidyl-2-C-methyl-D-erythritol kinase
MEFSAPAKINLSLRVLRKREDGFHEIETLMAPISLADTLEIERRPSGGLEFGCSDPSLPADGDNLVVRAVHSFCSALRVGPHLRIQLTKRVPHGAGLGGGSSDAAATLLALDQLFETRLPRAELSRMAAALGSDIPFFIAQGAAWCRGRGEIVEPCALDRALPLLLIKPPFPVPTPWAYRAWRDSLEIPGIPYAPQRFDWGELVNDLERPVFGKYLQLAEMKRWLLDQPETAGALMSGSGSTVFAVLREESAGAALMKKVSAQFGPHIWQAQAVTIASRAA